MKKLVTAIALSLLAHCSPGFSSYDLQSEAGKSSFAHRYLFPNTQKMGAAEEKWWNEFEASKQKDMAQYVHDLSKSNPEAAAWFLLTGGKNGFASRQATAEEEKLLLGAMKEVGPKLSSYQKAREWSQRSEIGQLHFGMLFKQMMQMQTELCALHQSNLLLTKEVTQLRSEVRETKVIVQNVVEEVKASFVDQLREMTEKAEKQRQEMWAKLDREREERDRQREEDHEKHLEAMDKNYVRLSRFYTPEGLQKSKQHKKAMEDFRDYYKGLMETLKDKLDYTQESLNPLLGFETSNNAKKLRKVVKLVKEIARTRGVESFVFDSEKPSNDELSEARSACYNKKISLRDEWYAEKQRLLDEWYAISTNPKSTKVEKAKAWAHKEKSEKEIWAHKVQAEKEAETAYSKLEQKLKDERDEVSQAETSKVLAQYGSVRKANQERLKVKYAEWQTKRSTLEALGIETSFEITQTVNNAFAGLLTAADMRDGLLETLEQRAEGLEKTAAREAREKEILKSFKMKELQVKARLYNKNYRKGFSNDSINEWIAGCFKVDVPFERIETAINERLTA